MTLRQRINADLARITFREPLCRLQPVLRVHPGRLRRSRQGDRWAVCCEVVVTLPDSVDGVLRSFSTAFYVDPDAAPKTWIPSVMAALLDRSRHEVAEATLLDGVAVCDPHRRVVPPKEVPCDTTP